MMQKNVVRLMIGVGVPFASALLMEQLPKAGVAEVPFAFQVDEQTLPAGTYSVKQADLGRRVRIQNQKVAELGTQCSARKRRFGAAQEARLVFHRHAGHYVLSEIWFDSDGRGMILPEGRADQKIGLTHEDEPPNYVRFR